MSLQASDITKVLGHKTILNHVSVTVEPGQCLGILGDNGSGKSTLMSILAGMQSPDEGCCLLDGNPITKLAQRRIGYVPQTPILIDELTVRDNLALWQSIYGLDGKLGVLHHVPPCLGLEYLLTKKVSALSGGMAKKVAIAIAVMHRPDYLILDEAFAALDAKTVAGMIDFLQFSTMGIVYSSHNIQEITTLCNRVTVLRSGEITHQSHHIQSFDQTVIDQLISHF